MIEDGESAPGSGLLKEYQDPGTPPGTLSSPDGEFGPARVVVASYTADGIEVRDIAEPAEFDALRSDGRVHWVHVIGLSDVALVEHMGRVFDLHPLALEDVLTLGQRPKAEEFDDTLFCIVQNLAYGKDGLEKTQVSLFLGANFVLTFQPRGNDLFSPVRERLVRGRARLRQKGAGYLMYALLDLVVDAAFPALEAMGDRLDTIEEGILEKYQRMYEIINTALYETL